MSGNREEAPAGTLTRAQLIIVTEGTVTNYEGHDPDCKPHVYTKGMTFIDSGGDHEHIIRNEGSVVAKTTAVQLIPEGAMRRIDVADPGHCLPDEGGTGIEGLERSRFARCPP